MINEEILGIVAEQYRLLSMGILAMEIDNENKTVYTSTDKISAHANKLMEIDIAKIKACMGEDTLISAYGKLFIALNINEDYAAAAQLKKEIENFAFSDPPLNTERQIDTLKKQYQQVITNITNK